MCSMCPCLPTGRYVVNLKPTQKLFNPSTRQLLQFLVIVEAVVIPVLIVVAVLLESLSGKDHRKGAGHAEQHRDRKEEANHFENETENRGFLDVRNGVVEPVGKRVVSIFRLEHQENEQGHAQYDHAELEVHFWRRLLLTSHGAALDLHDHETRLLVLHFTDEIHQQDKARKQNVDLHGFRARCAEQDGDIGDQEILDQLQDKRQRIGQWHAAAKHSQSELNQSPDKTEDGQHNTKAKN